MPKQTPSPPAGAPGTRRGRLRLLSVVLLALIAALFAVVGIRLYFAPPVDALVGALLGVVAAVSALAYGLSARWVAIQKRWGHITAIVVVALGLILGITANMTLLEWASLAANLIALIALAGSIPRREPKTDR